MLTYDTAHALYWISCLIRLIKQHMHNTRCGHRLAGLKASVASPLRAGFASNETLQTVLMHLRWEFVRPSTLRPWIHLGHRPAPFSRHSICQTSLIHTQHENRPCSCMTALVDHRSHIGLQLPKIATPTFIYHTAAYSIALNRGGNSSHLVHEPYPYRATAAFNRPGSWSYEPTTTQHRNRKEHFMARNQHSGLLKMQFSS